MKDEVVVIDFYNYITHHWHNKYYSMNLYCNSGRYDDSYTVYNNKKVYIISSDKKEVLDIAEDVQDHNHTIGYFEDVELKCKKA